VVNKWIGIAAVSLAGACPAYSPDAAAGDDDRGDAVAFGVHYDPAAGAPLYQAHCAACHDHPSGRTPAKDMIGANTAFYIFDALNNGAMRPQAIGLSPSERLAVAEYVSQNRSDGQGVENASDETPRCADAPRPLRLEGTGWNGWGRAVENTRYQPVAGLRTADLSRLKLKWAMAVGGNRNGQPVLVDGRLFTNDTAGSVYALDARSGCAHWRFTAEGPTRNSISLASLPTPKALKRTAAFFADAVGYLYALDAEDGTLIWRTKIDSQPGHQFTGSVTVYDGVVYAPISSGLEAFAMNDAYECCKFRGAVVAVAANSGKILWTTYTTRKEPKPFKKNRTGVQMYGPSGGAVWSAPTIDAKRRLIYVATGDSYTDVPYEGADAVIALALKTGKIVWIQQLTEHDSYIIGCVGPAEQRHANCPSVVGGDYDLGASPTLANLPDGKQIIVASQKSSQVYALDPDARGHVIWAKRLSVGGPLGGSEFGHAVDGANVYVGISDIYVGANARPQLTALRLTDGALAWSQPLVNRPCRWHNVYCNPGISMAVTAIPGAVLAGSMDGWLRAYSASDGTELWSFDTGQSFTTTTGARAEGGVLDGAGPVVADGMVFVHSGYWGRSGPGSVLLAFSVDGA
jgi:polyvinyl alcohol dehydrogenase (cytochrome)